MSDDYHYLCCNCGFITRHERWDLLKFDEDEEEFVPVEQGDSDPFMRCPVCQWIHIDDDSGPGIFDGPFYACQLERKVQEDMFQDLWNDVAMEVFGGV